MRLFATTLALNSNAPGTVDKTLLQLQVAAHCPIKIHSLLFGASGQITTQRSVQITSFLSSAVGTGAYGTDPTITREENMEATNTIQTVAKQGPPSSLWSADPYTLLTDILDTRFVHPMSREPIYFIRPLKLPSGAIFNVSVNCRDGSEAVPCIVGARFWE